MSKLLRAELYRMYRKKPLWLCSLFMMAVAVVFVIMQATALNYTVGLNRVIFLPMSFYGIAVAAMSSLFIGEDFSDGFIRNKLTAGSTRTAIYLSSMLVTALGCITVYLLTLTVSLGLGILFFEINVTAGNVLFYVVLGLFTTLAYASIFGMTSLLMGNRSSSVVVCMGFAFILLFLCLHTNQVLMQPEYKDGLFNPHYASGIRRTLYGFLHDLNPSGQAAQLSAMECFHTIRFLLADVLWIFLSDTLGLWFFHKKDIR